MNLTIIFSLVVLFTYITINILESRRKMNMDNDIDKVLKTMWEKVCEQKNPALIPIKKIKIMETCHIRFRRFDKIIEIIEYKKLVNSSADTINFTQYGVDHFTLYQYDIIK